MARKYGRVGMKDPFLYTSSINHGLLTEKALRDVFEITSYINFGTAEEPLPYPVKFKDRDSFFGKQIMTQTPKWGFQTNDVFFQKEHPWVFDGDLFVDRNMYVESQPDRYKGFWTSDFSKRDEYTNVMRTEQYREQLKLENKHSKKSVEQSEDRIKTIKAQYPDIDKPHRTRFDGPKYLYDVGRAGLATTKHCTRCHKQTYYCPHNAAYCTNNPGLKKDMGFHRTSSQDYGREADTANYAKPKYGNKPVIKQQMYRRTKIFFPPKTLLGFPA
ncbi:hypothetical protein Mapa_009330 [Marchantia paleacea]|nr:hypothetical protein Mapa_009330 [Marchantia paleacea]